MCFFTIKIDASEQLPAARVADPSPPTPAAAATPRHVTVTYKDPGIGSILPRKAWRRNEKKGKHIFLPESNLTFGYRDGNAALRTIPQLKLPSDPTPLRSIRYLTYLEHGI
ncbi:hypothetical protein LTR37_001566 [Vermiconidia calcicola]|uniref:Uncharacterized protein n=1 Tax=Vermiconidia calcicola TaxID=1690605 RepID=A0ACC3NWJ8_9PEZI|nr:hypothetical protein LTR37_001566 [Vermiconidia calcicola]